MSNISLIAAIGTPLTEEHTLHHEGLESHISDQWSNGMTGLLVGGTMGAMQMLTGAAYRQLVEQSIRFGAGRGEIMIGVGDTSFARTRERIGFLNEHRVDGVVILTPFFLKFSQAELIAYFSALADVSGNPVFLYDLPGLTGTRLEFETVMRLADHPNIRGIKCSGEFGQSRQLLDHAPGGFRVIVAQADLVDVLLRSGVAEHLDGVFSLAPAWVKSIADAAAAGDWEAAAQRQRRLSDLLRVLKQYGVFQVYSALLNARGIPGNFAPAPLRSLGEAELAAVKAEPVVQELLAAESEAPAADEISEFQPAK
jgi:4-hydroxy-tetrahydrodipicolinate synthase